MWGTGIVGFGSCHYRYASGREGDWLLTGFSSRRQDLVVYLMTGLDRCSPPLDGLGRHRGGKSCLYLERLDDVDLRVLERMVRDSVRRLRRPPPRGGKPA